MSGEKLFRKEALERLSSPERLDQLLKVVNPRAWLPLATMGSLLVAAAIWSVFGRLPLLVTGQGVLIQPGRVMQLQANSQGQVLTLNLIAGMTVKKGELLGTVDQSALKQQLQQEQAKLDELLAQNQDTRNLQKQRIALERETLVKQRVNLEERLRRESILPELREKSLVSLEKTRESLNQRLEQIKNLLPILEGRLEDRRRLLEEQLILGDVLLSAEQEYLNNLAQVSQLEAQLKELDVQESSIQRDYLQSLSNIDDIKTKIKELESQEARLAQEELEVYLSKTNKIGEVKRRIAQIELQLASQGKIISPYNGRVLEVSSFSGQIVAQGSRLGSIEAEETDTKLESIVYFADKDGKKIQPGMDVQVTPSLVKRERYGGVVGEVTKVSSFPVTLEDMSAILGNKNLAESIARSSSNAPVQVFVQLQTDPNTFSGYKWSSSQGPPLKLSSGTTAQVRVKVGEVAPIAYVIPLFRKWTGFY